MSVSTACSSAWRRKACRIPSSFSMRPAKKTKNKPISCRMWGERQCCEHDKDGRKWQCSKNDRITHSQLPAWAQVLRLSCAEGSNLVVHLESLVLRPCSSLILFPVSSSVQLYGKEICAWFVLGLVCRDWNATSLLVLPRVKWQLKLI